MSASTQRPGDGGSPRGTRVSFRLPLHLLELVLSAAALLALHHLMNGARFAAWRVNRQGMAMVTAIHRGDPGAVEVLLRHGADPNAPWPETWTPLLHAVALRRADVCQVLIKYGANVEGEPTALLTPLGCAAVLGEADLVRLLLHNGAGVDRPCTDGMTPLMLASSYGRADVAFLLIDAGADVSATSVHGVSPLAAALAAADVPAPPELLQRLIARGARVDVADDEGDQPLHLAAGAGDEAAIRLLLAHGADRRHRNVAGQTPADLAREHHPHLLELLEVPAP